MKAAVAERLAQLFSTGHRSIDEIVDDARNPSSPLHSEFIWDPEKAHIIYLKERARALIRQWYVEEVNGKDVPQKLRGAFSLPELIEDEEFVMRPARSYYTANEIFNSPVLEDRLLQTALAELNAFRRKYGKLKRLSGLFSEIDRLSSVKKIS